MDQFSESCLYFLSPFFFVITQTLQVYSRLLPPECCLLLCTEHNTVFVHGICNIYLTCPHLLALQAWLAEHGSRCCQAL